MIRRAVVWIFRCACVWLDAYLTAYAQCAYFKWNVFRYYYSRIDRTIQASNTFICAKNNYSHTNRMLWIISRWFVALLRIRHTRTHIGIRRWTLYRRVRKFTFSLPCNQFQSILYCVIFEDKIILQFNFAKISSSSLFTIVRTNAFKECICVYELQHAARDTTTFCMNAMRMLTFSLTTNHVHFIK